MSSILFSVIIPALNEEDALPLLLEDLQKQSVENFEVIVVDAKSTDKTQEKVRSFTKALALRLIESPKRNLSFQRNFGAKNARGVYLLFLDADTRINSDFMGKLQGYVDHEKKLLYLPYPKPSKKSFLNTFLFTIATTYVVALQKIGKILTFGPTIVIERKLFEKIGGFDETVYVAEDHQLVISAYKVGIKARFMPDVFYEYSTRRFESQGTLKIVLNYFLFTTMTLFKGAIRKSSIKYEMGGQHFKKDLK